MGKKASLSSEEKEILVRQLGNGIDTLKIAKNLGRDHRSVKKFIQDSGRTRTNGRQGKSQFSRRDLSKIAREMEKKPLSSSKEIFVSAGLDDIPRTTRCRYLKKFGKPCKAKKQPPLNTIQKEKRVNWAKNYMKMESSRVIFTDECRATLDGPDGFSTGWVRFNHDAPSRVRRQQGGGGIMFWAGIVYNQIVGPFKVAEGVKMNSENYRNFLTDNFVPWYQNLPPNEKKRMVFMQDNAPSHASSMTMDFLAGLGFFGSRLMTWPPSSPDLNPIENLWGIIKADVYRGNKQFTNKNDLWNSIVESCRKIEPETIKRLTQSMDERIIKVLQSNGDYIKN